MSEPSDGDGSEKPPESAAPDQAEKTEAASEKSDKAKAASKRARTGSDDVPATRRQSAVAIEKGGEPPARASQLDMRHTKETFPDDGTFSAKLRKFDAYVGVGEQGILVFLMSTLVLVTAAMAVADKLSDYRPHWKDDMIRSCTFGIAMFGGAFAGHQAKHLAMDLVSRRLEPRRRLFLRVFLGLFTAFIVLLFIRAGMQNVAQEARMAAEDKVLSNARLAYLIPIGGGLLLFHVLVHVVIDLDYIVRHKVPPERMRSH